MSSIILFQLYNYTKLVNFVKQLVKLIKQISEDWNISIN